MRLRLSKSRHGDVQSVGRDETGAAVQSGSVESALRVRVARTADWLTFGPATPLS